jgi:hypothetical protein
MMQRFCYSCAGVFHPLQIGREFSSNIIDLTQTLSNPSFLSIYL